MTDQPAAKTYLGTLPECDLGAQEKQAETMGEEYARLIAAAAERDRLVKMNDKLVYACQILVRLVGLKVTGDTPSEVKFARTALDEARQS